MVPGRCFRPAAPDVAAHPEEASLPHRCLDNPHCPRRHGSASQDSARSLPVLSLRNPTLVSSFSMSESLLKNLSLQGFIHKQPVGKNATWLKASKGERGDLPGQVGERRFRSEKIKLAFLELVRRLLHSEHI